MDLDNNRRKEPGDHEYRALLETFFCNWEQRNGVEVDGENELKRTDFF